MKKIVSILAVAAMAASMFAVDVSVTSKLSSTLFKYDGKAETVSALGVAAIVDFKNTFKDVTFGAGYSGNFGDVGVVLTAAYDVKAKKALIVPSLGGSVEGIGYALCAPVTIVKDANKFGLYASASYTVNSIGLKAYFEDANLAADTFACKIGLDVTGNVGIASWKVAPSYTAFSFKLVSNSFKVSCFITSIKVLI